MELTDEIIHSEDLFEAITESSNFVTVAEEAVEENKSVPSNNYFTRRVFSNRCFDFTSKVHPGNIVLPFKLGPYVPLESLSCNWQRHWNRNGSPSSIYQQIIYRVGLATFNTTKRREMDDLYSNILSKLISGVNMDTSFKPILPFNNTSSGGDGIAGIIDHYGRDPIRTINTALTMIEQKVLEFITTYGFITMQKRNESFSGLETLTDGISRIARHNPSSKYYYPFNGWMISGIGTLFDKQGLLQGCFFLPYDVYTYQYASFNKNSGNGQIYHGNLDIYTKANCFYVMSEKARKKGSSVDAIEHFIDKKVHQRNRDIPVYIVDDLLKLITGESFNDKVLTFE